MNLLVGIPTAGSPTQPFIESLKQLQLPDSVTGFANVSITGNFVPAQRELIARHALGANADYLLMIDDDIVVPPRAVLDLLGVFERHERCGIAGGLYYARDGVRPMAVANWKPYDTTAAYTPAFSSEPVAVDGVGFGCVLVKTAVFQALPQPYFAAQVFLEQTLRRVRVCNEDYLFCRRAAEAGFETYLHPGVRLGHHDRASGVTSPIAWESEAQTDRKRMSVVRPDGTFALEPLDETVPRIDERHLYVQLDYIVED